MHFHFCQGTNSLGINTSAPTFETSVSTTYRVSGTTPAGTGVGEVCRARLAVIIGDAVGVAVGTLASEPERGGIRRAGGVMPAVDGDLVPIHVRCHLPGDFFGACSRPDHGA